MRTGLALLCASLVLAAGCGGSGGTAPAAPAQAPSAAGTMTLTLSIPRLPTASARRAPRYVSPDMTSLAVYDGTTLIYVGNFASRGASNFTTVYAASGTSTVTAGSCTATTTITCTMTLTAAVGTHAFDVITYATNQSSASTSTPPVFTGVILSEGELSATVAQGTNPAATLTLLGVAASVAFSGPTFGLFNGTVTIGYQIDDAGGSQILQPGNFDNGPVTITVDKPSLVTFTPVSETTPPSTPGDESFTVKCVSPSGGTVTFTAAAGTHPNTAYASGLTYSSSNYASTPLGTYSLNCNGS